MYTLKLDLTGRQVRSLKLMLATEVARAERDETTDSPFGTDMRNIAEMIEVYERAAAPTIREAALVRIAAPEYLG